MKKKSRILKIYNLVSVKSPILPIIIVLSMCFFIMYFASRTNIDTYSSYSAILVDKNIIKLEVSGENMKNISQSSKVSWYINKSEATFGGQVFKIEENDGKKDIYIKNISKEKELEENDMVTVDIQAGKESLLKNIVKLGGY